MVVNFCGLRLGARPKRPRENDQRNEKCGLTTSMANFLKSRNSSCSAMRAKRRPVLPPEQQLNELTLKDWIALSPGVNTTEGEIGVHKQSSSRRIHPSSLKEEILLDDCSMSRRNEAGNSERGKKMKMKMKMKKVSFRTPEVAEVFVVDHQYSPEIMQQCMTANKSNMLSSNVLTEIKSMN